MDPALGEEQVVLAAGGDVGHAALVARDPHLGAEARHLARAGELRLGARRHGRHQAACGEDGDHQDHHDRDQPAAQHSTH